jgi:hypothetical protein
MISASRPTIVSWFFPPASPSGSLPLRAASGSPPATPFLSAQVAQASRPVAWPLPLVRWKPPHSHACLPLVCGGRMRPCGVVAEIETP